MKTTKSTLVAPRVTEERTEKICNLLQESHYLEWCGEYGEPGYSAPKSGILFCDWNDVSENLQTYLEQAGFELEWSDEWYIDYDNDRAWRTSPNCWGWVCALHYGDGFVLTPDDDLTEWIDACESTDASQLHASLPDWVEISDLMELGYQKWNGNFESGWHPGQNDNPEDTYKAIESAHPEVSSVLFRIDSAGQFDITWQAFYKVGAE